MLKASLTYARGGENSCLVLLDISAKENSQVFVGNSAEHAVFLKERCLKRLLKSSDRTGGVFKGGFEVENSLNWRIVNVRKLRRRRLPQQKSSNAALAVGKIFKEAVDGRI
jgi:hypothetical protein